MEGSGGSGGQDGAARHPLEQLLQMGLRATFGGMQGMAQQQQAPPQSGMPVPMMPQMPQIFVQMGGQAPQWEAFVREAMDAQGGADRPHPASKQAIRDMRKGKAHPPAPGALHVQHGGKCCCSPAPGADELAEACSVCQDDFAEGDDWIQMPCKHFFHADCLTPWLKEHNTCPTCRATVDEEPEPEPAQGASMPAAPPVQAAAAVDGPDADGRQQLLPDPPTGQMPMPFGLFPPGMFSQPQPAGRERVHAAMQAQQMRQQHAQQQWEQWIGRLDQASVQRGGAGANSRAPHSIDFRQLFGGLPNENMVRHMEQQRAEEDRQLQEAIAASMAEEQQRMATERHEGYTEDDLSQLSVRELKQFLDERSIDYSHCVEKSELLAEAANALRTRGEERGAAREADAAREAAELEEAIRLSLLEAEGAGGGL